MKIIISHDVDHLYRSDHFKDLTYPKLWVRETINLLKRRIELKEWFGRMISPLRKTRNHIIDTMKFDKKNNIPSSFFFGMEHGLGMSYSIEKARPMIELLINDNFIVGVHGVCFDDYEGIKKEYDAFRRIANINKLGIRMHYVRYNDETFNLLGKIGYSFDSTEFDKKRKSSIKSPYLIGKMWEFPIAIMDAYLPLDFSEAKAFTLSVIKEAEEKGIEIITVLFHDSYFSNEYNTIFQWYKWLVKYCNENSYQFISFDDAIKEMEE